MITILLIIIIIMLIERKKKHYLLYENLMVLHVNKLEFPSPKDALCQIWLKLAQRFWRRRFLNFVKVFSLFRNHLPLEKGGPFISSNLKPHHPRMFVPSLVKIGEMVLEKKIFEFRQCMFVKSGPFI